MSHFKAIILICCVAMLAACSGASGPAQYKLGGGQVVRLDLGDISLMAVEDASGSMDVSRFSGPLGDFARKSYFSGGKTPSSVNIFLLSVDGKLVLIDSGWGPEGRVRGTALAELAKIGVRPELIDYVLLTHLHSDHISGLLADGQAVFPNASVLASKPEVDFWMDEATLENATYTDGAMLAHKISEAYAGRFDTFDFGGTVLPGVEAVSATGHTPGHTAFLVGLGHNRVLIAGDFVHAAALQFAQPDECANYDMDPEQAAHSRRALMQMAVEQKLVLGGMHIPFSGLGTVAADGNGYEFTPLVTE